MKNFVGSKNGAGIKQWLISLMPAHRIYVECFLGKGAVMLAKRPAAVSIGIDYDAIGAGSHSRDCLSSTAMP